MWFMSTTKGIDCVRLSLAPAVGGFWTATLFLSTIFFRFKSLQYDQFRDDMGMMAFLFFVIVLCVSILVLREPPLCSCALPGYNKSVGFAADASTTYCFAAASPAASSSSSSTLSFQQSTKCATHDHNVSWIKQDHSTFASSTVETCRGSNEPTDDGSSVSNVTSLGECDSTQVQEISSVCSASLRQVC